MRSRNWAARSNSCALNGAAQLMLQLLQLRERPVLLNLRCQLAQGHERALPLELERFILQLLQRLDLLDGLTGPLSRLCRRRRSIASMAAALALTRDDVGAPLLQELLVLLALGVAVE